MHTIETAPRNESELGKLGRYELRTMAQNLGLMNSEEAKGAFMQLQNPEMAKQILPALLQYDKAKGGAAPAAKPPQTPVTSETKVPVSNGAGHKQPVNKDDTQGGLGVAQLIEAITRLNVTVSEIATKLHERFDAIEATQEDHTTILRGTNRIAMTGISLSLMLAEEVLKAPRADVVRDAHSDVDGLVTVLAELDPGISNATAEEEEETEEGKE
jgi:hypothetical protein